MDERVREDMACLIDSPYRGPLLLELRDGTVKQSELKTRVGASQATISRALGVFEERDWISRTGHTYQLTRLGEFVADTFEVLETTMATAHDLHGVVEHVPFDEMGFDIGRLRGATVIRPTQADPLAPIHHAREFLDGSEAVEMLSHAFSPGAIDVTHQRSQMEQTTSIVVTTDVLESLAADRQFSRQLHEAIANGMLDLWEYDGRIPYILAIADDAVSFGVDDEAGHVIAVIDTDDELVLEWAAETVERYRTESTKLDAARFSLE
ncbi:helix-turn-helix transcriptional regulator [Halomontanus rarus]|uniref:helix-turn-helix transcriptional regulator n=1 Tax=Halomontanus rarus TaxID=3034020 RepID=UPI00307CA566